MTKANRPLSPHLQVYTWGIHMIVSILHRATGAALAFGLLLLVWWLTALATGPDYYTYVNELLLSPVGRFVLLGITFSAMQHLATGIRHLIMDTGVLYNLERNRFSAQLTIVFSIIATLGIWYQAYALAGKI